jgi:hypothetical protein
VIKINFGLVTNKGGDVYPHEVLETMVEMGLNPTGVCFAESDTEPTLICEISREPSPDEVAALCERFSQDCFAVYDNVAKRGTLLGPKAAEWGPFNPEYFLVNCMGVRLSQVA